MACVHLFASEHVFARFNFFKRSGINGVHARATLGVDHAAQARLLQATAQASLVGRHLPQRLLVALYLGAHYLTEYVKGQLLGRVNLLLFARREEHARELRVKQHGHVLERFRYVLKVLFLKKYARLKPFEIADEKRLLAQLTLLGELGGKLTALLGLD